MRSRDAGWSSPVARWAHNPKVGGSNPPPATSLTCRWRPSLSDGLFAFPPPPKRAVPSHRSAQAVWPHPVPRVTMILPGEEFQIGPNCLEALATVS